MIYEIPLAAVAKKTLAFAWVVDDILRESLADDETDERFGTVVDRLVSGAGTSETNKVPRGDLAGLISDDFRPTSRQNVDGLFFVSVRVELRRLVARRNRDQMNANILEPTSSPSDLSIRIASGLRLWTRRIPSIAAIFSADKCIGDLLRVWFKTFQPFNRYAPLKPPPLSSPVHGGG